MPPVKKPATKRPATKKPAAKPAPPKAPDLTGLPILTGGSADPSVAAVLIPALNRCRTDALPIGDIVTADVLQAVKDLRQLRGVTEDLPVTDADNHIGPATWTLILGG